MSAESRREREHDTIIYMADGVRYMLLDLDRDPNALPAIRAYAVACQKSDPDFARRLGDILLDKHIENWNPESFTTTDATTTSNESES